MTRAEIIEYLYDNNVRADITIEQMADDLADRKTEPQYDAKEVAKDINRRVEMVKKEWSARHIEDEQTEREGE